MGVIAQLELHPKHLFVPIIEAMSAVLALRILTTMASMLVSVSPAADMYKIHREKTTGPKSILPVIALCCNSHIWMWYGYLTSKFFPLCLTSVFAQLCGSVFISIYYFHSAQRSRVRFMLIIAASIVSPVVCYTILTIAGLSGRTTTQVAHAIGYIGASFSISVLASPMERVKLVVRTKSAAALPAAMCCMSLVNTSLWLTYGIMSRDLFLVAPNSCGVVLCSIQVALCIIYRDKNPGSSPACVTDTELCECSSLDTLEAGDCRASESLELSLPLTPSSPFDSPKDTFEPELAEYAPMRTPRSLTVLAPVNA
jgi:solute carrier family 50 protein (sugar transporter)